MAIVIAPSGYRFDMPGSNAGEAYNYANPIPEQPSNSSSFDHLNSLHDMFGTSGRDKYYVYQYNIATFDVFQNFLAEAVLNYVLGLSPSLIDAIHSANYSNRYLKAEKFYKYAQKGHDTKGEEGYIYGLSDVHREVFAPNQEAIDAYGATLIPSNATVIKSTLHLRNDYRIRYIITETLGLLARDGEVEEYNQLPANAGTKLYLVGVGVTVTLTVAGKIVEESGVSELKAPIIFQPGLSVVNDMFGGLLEDKREETYKFVRVAPNGDETVELFNIEEEPYGYAPPRIEVRYTMPGDTPGFFRFHDHVTLEDTIPDVTYNATDASKITFYPILPIKIRGKNVLDLVPDQEYKDKLIAAGQPLPTADELAHAEKEMKSVKTAARLLGVDIAKISKELEASERGENTYSMWFNFAVHITTTDAIALQYLFKFFEWWSPAVNAVPNDDRKEYGHEEYQIFTSELNINSSLAVYAITEEINFGDLTADMNQKEKDTPNFQPVVGEVGMVTCDFRELYADYIPQGEDKEPKLDPTNLFTIFNIRKQIAPGVIKRITVHRLRHTSFSVSGEDIFNNANFTIPLIREIAETFSFKDKSRLFQLAGFLSFHVVNKVHLTFWTSTEFTVLFVVVIVVLVVLYIALTWDPEGTTAIVIGAISLYTAGQLALIALLEALYAFLLALIKAIIYAILLSVISHYASKWLGIWGVILVIAVAIVLGRADTAVGAVQGVVTSVKVLAAELLGLVMLIIEYVNNVILIEQQKFLDEQSLLHGKRRENDLEYERGEELLESQIGKPRDPLRPGIQGYIPYERSSQYLYRTTNSTAISLNSASIGGGIESYYSSFYSFDM